MPLQSSTAALASAIPFTGVSPSVVGDATLAASEWKQGIGCPTNLPPPYACFSSSDPADATNTGLFMAKTGPTTSDPTIDMSAYPAGIASDLAPYAAADLQGVAGASVADLTELGYDLRKPDSNFYANPAGSHCGFRAPRFNVVTKAADGTLSTHRFYCLDGLPPLGGTNQGWVRLRWTPDKADPAMALTDTIQSIQLIMDEGQDPLAGGSDVFGVVILDNIDVNGILVGSAPAVAPPPPPSGGGDDDGQGEDEHDHSFHFRLNWLNADRSRISYTDESQHLKFVSRTGARNLHSTGARCVAFDADGMVNRKSGYTASFEVCDLSDASHSAIGRFSITITGPNGFLYRNSSTMTKGRVNVH